MLQLSKYRTLGNSFLMVDNRDGSFDELSKDSMFKKYLCHMNFGIGSGAGVVEIKGHDEHVFEVIYHCAVSGLRGAACGTGSRCAVAFARDLGLVEDGKIFVFLSFEGKRTGSIVGSFVTTTMNNDSKIVKVYDEDNYLIDTKCYTYVRFVKSGYEEYNVVEEGMKVIGMEAYKSIFPPPSFILVKICQESGGVKIRAFDRESSETNELFGCGTGETGAVMAFAKKVGLLGKHSVPIRWRDGETSVTLTRDSRDTFSDITLSGNAVHVFDVSIDVEKFKMTYANK